MNTCVFYAWRDWRFKMTAIFFTETSTSQHAAVLHKHPQNYHFVFRMLRKKKPRLRHLMSVLQALMKVHENQEGLKPNVTYQLVRCANENRHGRPITREMSGIESKETSVQTCSILWILCFTQCVADDYVLLGHDSASMANGSPAFRESVMSSSSRVETSYIFNIRTQNPLDLHNFDMTLKLPFRATVHKHQLAWFRSCRSSDRIREMVTIYEAQFRITNLKFYSYTFSRGLRSECAHVAGNLLRQNR